ncbi:hypothetical protein Rxyl_1782 [Rubrobacter xylanophilus DSM 9941]|uniref:Uncharacterized protein n=1 Tax=Rubrobacter xylanophilus (strain DSM 9941 / JCM 11954 / NBRC 16129 / PRD-1) TaxID=266117 RepID=Q1AV37_RUBXD|nr:hypothetical protein [Rubrobacter xylanophilus]ABG04741.1 hypothetical protein Rxyl_1782 [Rubrobacter xylanophilus DSM 9941]
MSGFKTMSAVVDGERYRTALARLLASDAAGGVYLFRAHNSGYFVQRHGERDELEVLTPAEARALYERLPEKHQPPANAFPRELGGVGLDTETPYDDEEERERLRRYRGGDP